MRSPLCVLLVLSLLSANPVLGAPPYVVTEIALPPGAVTGSPIDINDSNQVLGSLSFDVAIHPFVWEKGTLIDLFGIDSPATGDAYHIDNRGRVVGFISPSYGSQSAFVWQAGTMTRMPSPADGAPVALGSNDQGTVVGARLLDPTGSRPLLWNDGDIVDPDPFGLPGEVCASAINNRDQVLLWRYIHPPGRSETFLWDNGSITAVADLGGQWGGKGFAMNDEAQIVGSVFDTADELFPFLWQDGQLTVLPSLPGHVGGVAFDINNAGQIVGEAGTGAALWQDGIAYDLNDLIPPNSGWVLYDAYGINSAGYIVGRGSLNHEPRGFLLSPVTVPEPCFTGLPAMVAVALLRIRPRRGSHSIW